MKTPFWLYVVWRIVKYLFLVFTFPIWAPVFFILYALFIAWEELGIWFINVRYDWRNRK